MLKPLILTALAVILFAGCGADTQQNLSEVNITKKEQQMVKYDLSDLPNVQLINADLGGMSDEQLAVSTGEILSGNDRC